MSNSNDLRIAMIEEVTAGVMPASPALKILPSTSQSMDPIIRTLESRTIRQNRNVADVIPVSNMSGGGIPLEMRWAASTEALFEVMRALMCAASETAEVDLTGCSTVSGTKNVTRPSGDWTVTHKVGDVVRIGLNGGGMVAADEGWGVLTTVTALTLTIKRTSNFTSNNTGLVMIRRGARMDNGSTYRSFALEIARLDIAKYAVFLNQVMNSADIRIATGSIATLGLGLTGGATSRSGTASGSSYPAPANRSVMDCIRVPLFMVGGIEYEATDIGLQINNNAQARERVGSIGITSIRRGQFRVSGSITWYLNDYAETDIWAANQTRDLVIVQQDSTGAAWSYALPAFKWTDIKTPTSGPNADDFGQGSFVGIEDPSGQGYTMRLQRFTA